jgi:hypothetical protein
MFCYDLPHLGSGEDDLQWQHGEVKEILSKCFEWNPVERPSAAKVLEVGVW